MKHKIKAVSIDGDGCLFAYMNVGSKFHSSWDALGFAYGLKSVWDERSRKYFENKLETQQWALDDAADLHGRELKIAEAVLYPIPYSRGVRDFLETTKGTLVRGLLSGCIDLVGKKAADETGMEFCFCNELHTKDGFFSGSIGYQVPTWEKHAHYPEICRRFELAPEEICHVGDHENDISCFERVGLAVAFNPKTEAVAKKAKYVIDDFQDLKKILGIG